MTRKLILILTIFLLALSACTPKSTPTENVEAPAATENVAGSYPGPEKESEPVEATQPESYPAPEAEKPAGVEAMAAPPVLRFQDDMDRSIELNGPAQRIVTLGPSSLESLFAIGAGSQIVGREEFSTYPDEALEITSVGSLWGEIPTEAILALEPDLVIAPEIISLEQIKTLEDLGLIIYFQANPTNFDGLWKNLRDLAALTGREVEAEALIAALDARVQTVQGKIAPLSYAPSVFYELDATDPQNPYTIGEDTFINTLIRMAGGINIGQVLEGQYAPISSEEVINQNPAIILLADAPYGVTPDMIAERAGWEVIAAVQDGKVYEFDPFLVSVPGPRMVDGLEAMAKIFHPEVFE